MEKQLKVLKRTIIDISINRHDVYKELEVDVVKNYIIEAFGGPDVFKDLVHDDIVDFKVFQNDHFCKTVIRIVISSSANMDYKGIISKFILLDIENILSNYNKTERLFDSIISTNIESIISIANVSKLSTNIMNIISSDSKIVNEKFDIKAILYRDSFDDEIIKTDLKIELSINDSLVENVRKQKGLIEYTDFVLSLYE